MVTLKVFEPALCCATGACGPNVDKALVQFGADVEWLRSVGVTVERANLAQNPAAFTENDTVMQELRAGLASLPLVMVDGRIASRGNYPSREQLAQWSGLSPVETLPVVDTSCCGGQKCC